MSNGDADSVRSALDAFLLGDFDALGEGLQLEAQWLWCLPNANDCHDAGKVSPRCASGNRTAETWGCKRRTRWRIWRAS
ncbi:hypothetical protein [Candidatus Solirubrobacter pratensis]|uniref:hypothetical protein n=1 Tax=Candidatus Solirubrobacter pratensis TaxID=1298857 RepID=UPI0012DD8606|nr:hypothetical protein [Candidatus Solirubrobacter pratensis]